MQHTLVCQYKEANFPPKLEATLMSRLADRVPVSRRPSCVAMACRATGIAEETKPWLNTVRTIIGRSNGTDLTSKAARPKNGRYWG